MALLHEGYELHFFVENETGSQEYRFWQKVARYREYRDSHRERPFRVLVVCKSEGYKGKLRGQLRSMKVTGLFWFACESQFNLPYPEKLLDPIWTIPGDEKLHHILE
jgi:hypothetical protein